MYIPKHFEEKDASQLLSLISAYPLATVVVQTGDLPVVNHLPLIPDPSDTSSVRLKGHVPRANLLSTSISDGCPCIAVFHGPQGYISPSWYATKQAHGRVVPTWNYEVVHCHGRITLRDDPDWVLDQVTELTDSQESGRDQRWFTSDAPEEFTTRLVNSLVGIEVDVEEMRGKSKLSQNQPIENQQSLLDAMKQAPGYSELFSRMQAVLNDEVKGG